ncbi:unnamed protein product [Musa acuminata subsp. burmannicoides]
MGSSSGPGHSYDYSFKILLIGDSAVGKSSLLVSFISNHLGEDLAPTIGVDFKIKHLTVDDKKLKLTIWDTEISGCPYGLLDSFLWNPFPKDLSLDLLLVPMDTQIDIQYNALQEEISSFFRMSCHLFGFFFKPGFGFSRKCRAWVELMYATLPLASRETMTTRPHIMTVILYGNSLKDCRIMTDTHAAMKIIYRQQNGYTGQERFRTLTSSYYRGCQGIILVYDVTKRETFTNLADVWVKEVELYATNHNCVKVLVGNKVDKEADRMVTREEGNAFANEYGCLFLECSAKTRANVERCFEELALKILEVPKLVEEGSVPVKRNILKLQQEQHAHPGGGGCCSS